MPLPQRASPKSSRRAFVANTQGLAQAHIRADISFLMDMLSLPLADEAATLAAGAMMAPALRAGDVILLNGPLGAGKTTFARGLIKAFAGANEVPSPTFTLVETYDAGPVPLWHFDLYRLEKPSDVWELGLEEALDNAISLIEWPNRVENIEFDAPMTINIDIAGAGGRVLRIAAPDSWAQRLTDVGMIKRR